MRWTRRGAHLLLQIRTRVLDDTLAATFQRWYPGMETGESPQELALAAKESIGTCLEGLGAVVTTQGSVEAPLAGARWAVQLWGAAETLRQDIGAPLPPVYRADYEQAVTAARSALGEKAFAAALAEGRTMTPELALASQGREMMPKTVPGGRGAVSDSTGTDRCAGS